VRLLLGVIAYNLGNLLRRLVLPVAIQDWSLTSLQQRLLNVIFQNHSPGAFPKHSPAPAVVVRASYVLGDPVSKSFLERRRISAGRGQ
jgi:hypothetical protein